MSASALDWPALLRERADAAYAKSAELHHILPGCVEARMLRYATAMYRLLADAVEDGEEWAADSAEVGDMLAYAARHIPPVHPVQGGSLDALLIALRVSAD